MMSKKPVKNIFITGGTTGIGLSLAKLYAEDGHKVGICGRDLTKLDPSFLKQYPLISAYKVDVTDGDALKRAIEEFSNGNLDIVIASAGVGIGGKKSVPDFRFARQLININLIGVLNTFEAVLKMMLARGKGQVVAISSVAGMIGVPGAAAYSASKAGVLKLCESFAIDLEDHGISVTAIAPGFVDTPMTRENNHPMIFLMDSDTAAHKIKRAIEKKKVLFVFPFRMGMIIYILAMIPRGWYHFFMKMVKKLLGRK